MSRGRGRGRGGGMSFNLEAIGFGRGDTLPAPLLQPPPKYPALRKRAQPLMEGDEQECLLSILKDYEFTMKNSQYYLKPNEKKIYIERYSDKYKKTSSSSCNLKWIKDCTYLPSELRIQQRKKKKVDIAKATNKPKVDVVKELEVLEKKDENAEDQTETEEGAEKKKQNDNSEVESEVEDFEGEEDEEENDYLTSYFDNGESYLDEEEDNLEDKEGGIY